MNQDEIWAILEIEPTRDKKVIRRAYAKLSREHHMEEEPELFRKISEAYRQALRGADSVSARKHAKPGMDVRKAQEPERAEDIAAEKVTEKAEEDSPSLLSRLEEAEEEKLQRTRSLGALSEMIAILNDPQRKNSLSEWKRYFLSEAFLDEQFDESFGKGMMEYFNKLPEELLQSLPQNFVLELAVAFGLVPDAIKVGAVKHDKRGREYWDCIYRVNGEGSFYNRKAAADLYNWQEVAGGEEWYRLLAERSENRLRANSFSAYIKLRRMNAEGHLNKTERSKWEKIFQGGDTQSECFVPLLEYWVRADHVPKDVLCFLYDCYGLKDIDHSDMRDLYAGLKEAILNRLPEIEETLYAETSIIQRRKRWIRAFQEVLSAHYDNFCQDIYEDTEEIQKRVDDLFHGEDWRVLNQDTWTFEEICSAFSNREVIPQTIADFLLDFYEREGDFANPDMVWELTLRLLRSKGLIRRMRETDPFRSYDYEKTEASDIAADNEQFLVYLLSRGFGNRYFPVVGSEEIRVPYVRENRLYLSAFVDEIYHPFFIGDEQWNPMPGWQKVFTHFDEEQNDISDPVRDEFEVPDGNRLTVEFHLHYILYFWNGEQVVDPVLRFEELKGLAEDITDPVHFLYLLAVTRVEGSEREEARDLIYGWLEKTCITPQLQPMLAQLLCCDNAGLPAEENEARRVVAVCYGEQERFCFRMTVSRRNVKLYRQTRYGWEEMKLLDGEGKRAKTTDIEGKIAFCREKLQKLRQPKPVLLSRRDIRELSRVEKARAIIEAMKEGEIARRNRTSPYMPGFPWNPDEITDSVREFFRRDGGWMTEGYCVLHMGERSGKQFDRIFWAKMNIFGFDLGFMSREFSWSLDDNVAKINSRIPEKHLSVGYFGWGRRYSPKGWMEPMALAVGESGTFYMHDFDQLYQAQTLEELFAKVYTYWDDVTTVEVYEGMLTVSRFDHSLEYCYTREDRQEWLDSKTTLLPEVFTKFGI